NSAAIVYGWKFAAFVPLRMLHGNLVNFAATATALWDFFDALRHGRSLSWRKTAHIYPDLMPAAATGVDQYRQPAGNQELAGVSSPYAIGDPAQPVVQTAPPWAGLRPPAAWESFGRPENSRSAFGLPPALAVRMERAAPSPRQRASAAVPPALLRR